MGTSCWVLLPPASTGEKSGVGAVCVTPPVLPPSQQDPLEQRPQELAVPPPKPLGSPALPAEPELGRRPIAQKRKSERNRLSWGWRRNTCSSPRLGAGGGVWVCPW